MTANGSDRAEVVSDSGALRRELRQAGITARAIDAVWPEWWSTEAENSLSASTELRYTIARRLGLSPRSLFEGPPRFVWRGHAKFKNLGTRTERELETLTSFSIAVGRVAIDAAGSPPTMSAFLTASELRSSILASSPFVSLNELLAASWALGIPVLQLALFPMRQKKMHAMTVRVDDRYCVLIGYRSKFPAQIAYAIAHELGHIELQHLSQSAALLEIEDPLKVTDSDHEESAADHFALELLTGRPDPRVEADRPNFNARELANAAVQAAPQQRVDAGILALCLGHATGRWRQAFGALKMIAPGEADVGEIINGLARLQLDWDAISLENRDFLMKVMGDTSAARGSHR